MTDDDEAPDPRTIQALADAAALTGATCRKCAAELCGHEAVFCLVLGYKGAPHCLSCVAAHMRERVAELRERALDYVRHHDCFLAAWHHAGVAEGFGEVARPGCLFGDGAPDATAATGPADVGPADVGPAASEPAAGDGAAQASWDAGGMGCGDLVLELRLRLAEVAPGGLFDLRATDPGAPTDLPAWCAMTGHALVAAEHPRYRIRRRM